MAHLALYRKYRSQSFSDLVGQDHVVKTLRSAVATDKFSHAYLFTGPRGTGKTSTARLLAKALNCPRCEEGEPCGECDACTSIADGSAMDVVEIDAASESGVDDVRETIVEAAEYRPAIFPYKVFIIDEVHDLSPKAFDALLKTIEEPPGHIVFILATTEYGKVPPTIRSRCQRFEFHRGGMKDLVDRLSYVAKAEGVACEPQALAAIAKMADGGFRDSLTLFEQAMLTADGTVTLEHVYAQLGLIADDVADSLLLAIVESDVKEIIAQTSEVYRQGRDPRSILEALLYRLSDLTRALYGVDVAGSADQAEEARLHDSATKIGSHRLLALRSEIAQAHRLIRDISLPRIWLEAELIRIGQTIVAGAVVRPAAAPAPAAQKPAPAVREPAPEAAKPAPPKAEAPKPEPPQAEAPEPEPEKPFEPETPAPAEPAPAAAPAAASGQEDQIWSEIVKTLSEQSKLARNRLPKSTVVSVDNGVVTIAFDRLNDAEWVNGRDKVKASIADQWKQRSGTSPTLIFIARAGEMAPKRAQTGESSPTKVESAYEGSRLAEAAKEVFGEMGGAQGQDQGKGS